MALKNKLMILSSLGLMWFNNLNAKIILSELLAKQAINNIRFLTQDGKYTYYQKRSGSLLFSTNYKSQEILKGKIGTHYTLFATSARKKIVILQNISFQNFYSLRAKEKIFLVNFGGNSPVEIGLGVSPQLLFNDSWLSYYDPYTKILSFESTTNSALKFSIKLNNKINPYFTPQVVMVDDDTVYYTDLNEAGNVGRNTGKTEILYKVNSAMLKAEICIQDNNLILSQFGIHNSNQGSTIFRLPLPIKKITNKEVIYQSEQNDLGHLVCNFEKGNLNFIKNFGTVLNPQYDIVNLDMTTKKITPLSEIKTVSNIINMDGILLTQDKGRHYIVKGDVDYKNIDSLKAKTENKINTDSKNMEKVLENQLDNE
jgi:hypothetical protein